MKKITFTADTRRHTVASFAVAKDNETPIEAVKRSIERTSGYRVHYARHMHWTQNHDGSHASDTFQVTLTERTQNRQGGGWGVTGEFGVTIFN